jgi:hypothetical protein
MTDFNILLKYFKKIGYPNKNLHTLFKSLDYNPDNFLTDMVETLGEDVAREFVQKTIDKLNTSEGIRIDLEDAGYPESYIYLKIRQFRIDLEESEDAILILYSWGDGMIMNIEDNKLYTKEELRQNCDMGEWNDVLDVFEGAANNFFYSNCGYWFWYE